MDSSVHGEEPKSQKQPGIEAVNLGKTGVPDGKFCFETGLSLFVEGKTSPPGFLQRFEQFCIPGDGVSTSDMLVYYKGGDLNATKDAGNKFIIDTSRIKLLRFGVMYEARHNRRRVISQDPAGNVWDHPIEELPAYSSDDWNFYGLRIPPEQQVYKPQPDYPRPDQVLDTWLKVKQQS